MKSVLVMGGSYFIGKKIVEVLLSKNYKVSTLNRGSREVTDPRINNIISDRNDFTSMKNALNELKFDYVVDVCGLNQTQMEILCASVDRSIMKKFILISSSAVYDIDNLEIPYSETDTVSENKIWTFYGTNKIESEEYLCSFFKNTGIDFIALRPPYVYGEDNYAQRESFVFEHIENDKPIILPNNGESKFQFIYSTDLAYTVESVLSKETKEHMVFNVGNTDTISFKEWVEHCANIVGKKAKIVPFDYQSHNRKDREFFPFFDYDNVLNTKKIKKYYNKETTFQNGLKNAYEWYCDNKGSIRFKEKVTENEKEILQLLDY